MDVLAGIFRENFDISEGIGDALELSDDEGENAVPKKNRSQGLPPVDGPEPVEQHVSKYKKYLLNRRAAYKDAVERLKKDACQGHERLRLV